MAEIAHAPAVEGENAATEIGAGDAPSQIPDTAKTNTPAVLEAVSAPYSAAERVNIQVPSINNIYP